MGTPTPPPSPPGDPCGPCDGVLWPVGVTPRFIEVDLWDLVKCPLCPFDPPNGKFWLEQKAADATMWKYEDSAYLITVDLDAVNTYVHATSLTDPPGWQFFVNTRAGCQYAFVNEYVACGGDKGSINGEAHVYWPGP